MQTTRRPPSSKVQMKVRCNREVQSLASYQRDHYAAWWAIPVAQLKAKGK